MVLFLVVTNVDSFAQTKAATNEKALQILDKAIGDVFSSENIGIYFEGIAFGIKKPEDIFTIPVYKVFRGGFLFVNKEKYQLELGLMKSISNGKLMVVIDEQSKTMVIDSVRNTAGNDTIGELDSKELADLISEDFKEATLTYEGVVTINNHKCHKIKSIVTKKAGSTDVLYWVDTVTGQLFLMAENQNNAYNVYWFNRVGKAPENFKYDIFLPEKTLTTFHGYKVIDNRFSVEN